jgi:hypothetical protein
VEIKTCPLLKINCSYHPASCPANPAIHAAERWQQNHFAFSPSFAITGNLLAARLP